MKKLIAVGLILLVQACSDDTKQIIDSRIADLVSPDKGRGDVAKADLKGDAKADGAATIKYSASVVALEIVGRTTWGPAKPGDPVGKIMNLGGSFTAQDPTSKIKPDFIDSPNPPNCYAYAWKSTEVPNRTDGDAGKITFTGHQQVAYVDAENPGAPKQLPATIECVRKPVGTSSFFVYDCGIPKTTALVSDSWLLDTSKLDVTVSGGKDVATFSQSQLPVSPAVKPKATFDMAQQDPSKGMTIEWEPVTAQLIAIFIRAQLKDGSAFGEINCITLAALGSKAIPQAALDLMPKPTATAPLIMRTSMVAFSPAGAGTTWGSYLVAAGRGSFGVSCLTPAGQCPQP